MLTLQLIKKVRAQTVSIKDIRRISKFFNQFFKVNIKINVVIIDKKEIQKLNKLYRKKNKVTDVLSFSYNDDMGEVLICYTQAKKQAQLNKIKITEEICRLIIHGILHILGFDHEKTQRQARLMEKWENKIYKLCLA